MVGGLTADITRGALAPSGTRCVGQIFTALY